MDAYDNTERIAKIIKYGKYVVLLVIIAVAFLLIKGCGVNYKKIEEQMVDAAKAYVYEKNLVITKETYIEIGNFDLIAGTELCNKSSGVIVSPQNGDLKYQAFLKCPDYSTKLVENKSKFITLNGDEVTILNKGELFKDSYYTITGELVNGYVDVRGIVNNTPGVYNVYYDVYYPLDTGSSTEDVENYELVETLVRKVIVTVSDKNATISGLVNTEEPYLQLYGETNIILSKGEKYSEPGYEAYDYVDGKIGRRVIVTGEVDTSKVRLYDIVYSVTNSRGKTKVAVRHVTVVQKKANLQVNVTKTEKENKVLVSVNVVGDGFDKMYGVNSESVNGRTYSFTAIQNKTYSVTVIDVYGNSIVKEISISEIDDEKPKGTCKAVAVYGKTMITVTASDNKGIAGYIFKTNNHSSKFVTTANYEASEKATIASVIIRDVSGNEIEAQCDIEEGGGVYVSELGYNCLYPYTCFKQGDYGDYHYEFCSTDTCGPISRRGCSITSVTTIVSGLGVKDKNGELYTPYTMLREVYDKQACLYKNCSGSTASYRAFNYLGLTVTRSDEDRNAYYFSRDKIPIILEHLRKGGAVLVRAKGPGMYVVSKGHLMALLGVNDNDEVFLSDPNTKYGETNGKGPVNTFISTEYLVKGQITWFQLVSK